MSATTAARLPPAIAEQSGWKLTFAEEWRSATGLFNSNPSTRDGGFKSPNGRWNTLFPYGGGERTLPANGEQQWYQDPGWPQDPFTLTNNGMRITAHIADPAHFGGQFNPQSYPYISGVLTTDDAFRQKYGYWEVRMKTPQGKGFWPALWLLARDHEYYTVKEPNTYEWPPEIDIMEGHGNRFTQLHYNWHSFRQDMATGQIPGGAAWRTDPDPLRQFQSSAATKGFSPGGAGWVNLPTDLTSGFHNYAVLWDATEIKFYFDDVHYATLPTQWDMHVEMYLIIQLAVGGHWPGSPDSLTPFPAHLDIDYVRVYSNDHLRQPIEVSFYTDQAGQYYSDTFRYISGHKFSTTTAGQVTKLRVYKANSGQVFHNVKLWNSDTATLLATAPAIPNGAPTGWITQTLSTPVSISPGVNYMVSYDSNGISYIPGGLSGPRTSGPLTTPAYPNGGYIASTTTGTEMPNSPNGNTNSHMADLVFAY